jgi:hypothetical protein
MDAAIPLPSATLIEARIHSCRNELAELKRALRALRAVEKAEQARRARAAGTSGGAERGRA